MFLRFVFRGLLFVVIVAVYSCCRCAVALFVVVVVCYCALSWFVCGVVLVVVVCLEWWHTSCGLTFACALLSFVVL